MKEKFSDYETGYLAIDGTFDFTITDYELTDGPKGPVAKFEVKAAEGMTTIYHSLNAKARWSYNKLIKACLKLTPAQAASFELDYETIGNELIGKTFVGVVECQTYDKVIKEQQDDGTFSERVEKRENYKIVDYKI